MPTTTIVDASTIQTVEDPVTINETPGEINARIKNNTAEITRLQSLIADDQTKIGLYNTWLSQQPIPPTDSDTTQNPGLPG